MTHPPTTPKRVAVELLGSLFVACLALAFLCALSGCQLIAPKIVTTEIRKTDAGFEIISPKDTTVTFAGNPAGYFFFNYNAVASKEALEAGQNEANARAQAVGKLAEAAASLK